jgi:hypothetical protein
MHNANIWGNVWTIISDNIDSTLDSAMKLKYNHINNKLNKLKEDNIVHTQQSEHVFYQRIEKLSNITFSNEETALLSKGLKYNLHYKQKNWIRTLAIEADAAINLLNPHEQAYMRQAVTKNLRKLINKETWTEKRDTHAVRSAITEKKLIQNLHSKLEQNNLILTKADKGNTVIIIHKDVYHQKINDFISQHKFTKVRNNYTNVQQKAVKTAINACKTTIKRHDKWKYINMNPKAPYIFGNIKLHKAYQPIRPIVNWRNSPG